MNRASRFALLLVTSSVLAVAAVAAADPLPFWKVPPRPARTPRAPVPSFAATGVYGGFIGNQVTIDGVNYTLRQKTQPYMVGTGLVSMSDVPIGSHVYATVVGSEQSGVIWGLIVRPAGEDRGTRGGDLPPARVWSEDAPR